MACTWEGIEVQDINIAKDGGGRSLPWSVYAAAPHTGSDNCSPDIAPIAILWF
jgi:hypothetical protein